MFLRKEKEKSTEVAVSCVVERTFLQNRAEILNVQIPLYYLKHRRAFPQLGNVNICVEIGLFSIFDTRRVEIRSILQ